MPAPIPYYPGGTYTGVTRVASFSSTVSGEISGTVTVPSGSATVLVRFRRLRDPYADTDYAIADASTDVLNAAGETIRDFTITGLTPGRTYAILAQAGDGSDVGLPSQEYLAQVAGASLDRSSYLPIGIIEHTEFPRADGKDVAMQIRQIEELWRRNYPKIEYYNIKKATSPALDGDDELDLVVLSGEEGFTEFDVLWGESVPETVADVDTWVQPHGKATHSVDSHDVFWPKVEFHARIQRESKERQLKKWGFDKIRDILVFIPLSSLDRHGITVDVGDKFWWDGDEFNVLQHRKTGYWKNSNVRLYIVMNCEHRRLGS